jgi:hypothetical protein
MKLPKRLKHISVLSLLALAGFTTSCDYLDVVPPEQPNLSDATSSHDRALGFLYSCYKGTVAGDNAWNYLGEIMSSTDETVLPFSWTEGNWQAYSFNTASPNNQNWLWGTTYKYVGQCLLFLQELDKVNNVDYISAEEHKQWRAEAKFLIAYYHFMTLRRYGPIPITDSYIAMDPPASQYNGRFHFDYCVDWIANMLDEAAKDLPAIQAQSTDWGRATSTICKAVKARLLLYAASPLYNGKFPYPSWKNENFETPGYGKELISKTYDVTKWNRALEANLEALELALGAGDRELYDNETFYQTKQISLDNMYVPGITDGDLTTEEKEAFLKKVLKMQFSVTTRESDGNKEMIWGVAPSSAPSLFAMFPHRIIQMSSGTWSSGWSGQAPTLNTVERFYTKNGKRPADDPDFVNRSQWFESANLTRTDVINLNANREPRFYAWIAFDGGNYGGPKFKAGKPLKLELRNGTLHGYNTSLFNRDNNVTGYLCQKFVHPNLEFSSVTADTYSGQTTAQWALFRLNELYLNVAECYAELGDTENALKYLNPIRERAGVPALTKEDVTAEMDIVEWTHNERFVELWQEGHRFYDVRRWVKGDVYLGANVRRGLSAEKLNPTFEEFNTERVLTQYPYAWSNRMYLNPVFYNEVYKNPQMVQAPGY